MDNQLSSFVAQFPISQEIDEKKILNDNPQDENNVDKDNENDCNDRDDCKNGFYSIRASHANHVNRNQCSCCGTHKSL